MRFDEVIVIDWSSGNDRGPTPKKDAIWSAAIIGEAEEEPVYHRNRDVALAWLTNRIDAALAADRRLMIALDFPFGYPSGFAERLVGRPDPLAVWDWIADRLEDTPERNNRFALAGEINRQMPGVGPFWFNATGDDIDHLPRKGNARRDTGLPEKRIAEQRTKGAFTCWQMGGAGAVGGQAMTGMAALSRLRRRYPDALAVWPFQKLSAPIAVVEIWPTLIDPAVRDTADPIRDRAQVRLLARALARQTPEALGDMLDVDAPEEGWILGLGHEDKLIEAARNTRPLKNDCFALPPGVDWTPVDDALANLAARLHPVVDTQRLSPAAASGLYLAEDVTAARSHPPAANAAVDGYGFAHATLPDGDATLPLLDGRAAAGAPYAGSVPDGHAIRILTGALLPEGVDTVVLEEDVTCDDGHVRFPAGLKPGANARRAGEDVTAGAVALAAGTRLGAPEIGLLAAVGVTTATVYRRLRVGVLSTGDELASPGETADPSRTYDANRPMLLALLDRWQVEAVDLGHVGDDRADLKARLDAAATRTDAILTSGGASAGDEDHVSALLGETGSRADWRIALKPGRPLALGVWQGTPVFGLPGNPVAALVCTLVFARPALALLGGGTFTPPQGFTVPAAFTKRKKPGRREYLRARLTADGHAEVFPSEGSGRISGLAWADGLVELEDGARDIEPGDPVRYIPYTSFGL